jgi:hypothetical protein
MIERHLKRLAEAQQAAKNADPEYRAWERILAAEEKAYRSRRTLENHSDTGIEFAAAAKAEDELKTARADYLEAFGKGGKHLAARKAERDAEQARRDREHAAHMQRTGGWGD